MSWKTRACTSGRTRPVMEGTYHGIIRSGCWIAERLRRKYSLSRIWKQRSASTGLSFAGQSCAKKGASETQCTRRFNGSSEDSISTLRTRRQVIRKTPRRQRRTSRVRLLGELVAPLTTLWTLTSLRVLLQGKWTSQLTEDLPIRIPGWVRSG